MRLTDAKFHKVYKVSSINFVDDVFNSRLAQLGVLPGVEIELKNVAPIFKNPMLFNVGESQIAMTVQEASHISIEEVQ